MCILRIYLAFFALLVLFPVSAQAGERVALVVGNGTYAAGGQLANPVNDARIVGDSLQQAGFDVVSVTNVSFSQFRTALSNFRVRAQGADVAMVYFAGHGIEANGKNWLLPVDARLQSDYDLSFEAIGLDQVMGALAGARVRMVVLDACRNNPFGQDWKGTTRAITRGLGRLEADDVLVMFAAAPGSTVSEGAGGNSPFARALARRLVEPGLTVQRLGGMVRDDVIKTTGGAQQPFVSASMTGQPVYLVPGNAPSVPAPAPASSPGLVFPATQPQAGSNVAALILECDRLAGSEWDSDRPQAAPFVAFDDIQPALAIPACTRALDASPGNARIMAQLARSLDQGKDYAEARRWYEQAAAMGNSSAMTELGVDYEIGRGVTQDFVQAHRWLEQGAAKGNGYAMTELGFLYTHGRGVTQDYAQGLRWYERGAAKGNVFAMFNLGVLYANGNGVTQDYAQARRWYEQAAAKGETGSMNNLGVMYRVGLGVTQDYAQARHWFEQGAELGEPSAMKNLGLLYMNGQGVPKDPAQARRWFEQAAEAGDEAAKKWLADNPQ